MLRAAFLYMGLASSLAFTTAVCGEEPVERLDAWRILGMGGGGTTLRMTVSPHDAGTALVLSDMSDAFITTSGGKAWRMFNLRTGVASFAFDPTNKDVIYAGNVGLFKSADRGKTWSLIYPDPAKNTVEHKNGDHADYFLTSEDENYLANGGEPSIDRIAVDPHDGRRVYIAMSNTQKGNLLLATPDGGKTWEALAQLGAGRALALFVTPSEAEQLRTVYCITEDGIYSGRGANFAKSPGPADKLIRASIGHGAGEDADTVLYVTAAVEKGEKGLSGGIFRSHDGGQTWIDCAKTLLKGVPADGELPHFQALACAQEKPEVVYVGFTALKISGADKPATGIAKSIDAGETWELVHVEAGKPNPAFEGSYIEGRALDSMPNVWFDQAYDLAVAPKNPDVCYGSDLFRTYRTENGGKNWKQLSSKKIGEDEYVSRGIDVTNCYGVHFDPHNPKNMFISYTDMGGFRSVNGGQTWIMASIGIPNLWRNTLYWLEYDPDVPDLIFGAWSATHDLPRPRMWRKTDPDTYAGGVAISNDGGKTWNVSNKGLPETSVTHILLDPTSPKGQRTLYICGFGKGVFKSTDNGQTWVEKNKGLEGKQPFAWRLARAKDGTLYLVVARRSERGEIGDANDGALYVSKDGAESWSKLKLPEGCNGPNGLTIDPNEPQRLYLSAWGRYAHSGDLGGGVFLSTDGGATWKNIFNAGQHVYDLTIDVQDTKRLFITGFDSGAWRSDDQGATWSRLRGFNFKFGHRVFIDPQDRSKVYIATFGGSLWHGSAAGDPQAAEDVVPEIAQPKP